MSRFLSPARSEAKARYFPSGEMAGCKASPESNVNCFISAGGRIASFFSRSHIKPTAATTARTPAAAKATHRLDCFGRLDVF
jgi:hypothetical protein